MDSTTTTTITIEDERRPVRKAEFGIGIQTQVWDEDSKSWKWGLEHGQAGYWLEVDVDEHSGNDGEPAPTIQNIPVTRANGGGHPSLSELGTLTVTELDDGYDCEEWAAWFDNDAPGLCGNVVRFQGWDGPRLSLRWESEYDDFGTNKPLVVEGPFDFVGIHVSVPMGADPDEYLVKLWGGQPPETFARYELSRTDHGEGWPAAWRHTVSYVYSPAGTPLSSYWRRSGDAATPAPDATPSAAPAAASEQTREPKSLQRLPAGRVGFRSGQCSLELTDGWESVEQGLLLDSLRALSLRLIDVHPRVVLFAFAARLHPGVSLDDYVCNSNAAYKSVWSVEADATTAIGELPARRLEIRQSVPGDEARILKYYLVADPEHAIVLTFVARTPDDFATRLPGFEAIAQSVRIDRPLVDEA